jgi:DNA-binding beta-propeller fold protein YncE
MHRSPLAHLLVAAVTLAASTASAQVPIPLPHPASAVAVNPITNQIWVLSEAEDAVMRVDGASHDVAPVAVADAPRELRVDPLRNRVYVLHAGGQVTLVDGRTLAVTPIGGASGSALLAGLALDPARNRIFATAPGTLRVIDGSDLSIDAVAIPGYAFSTPQRVVVDPITGWAYTGSLGCCDLEGNDETKLHQVQADPPAVHDSITVLASPALLSHRGLGVDPSTGLTYSMLSNGTGLDVWVRTDWASATLLTQAFGGGIQLLMEPTGGRFWARGPGDGFSCGWSGAARLATLATVAGTFHSQCAGGITVNPATPRAYLADFDSLGTETLSIWTVDPVAPAIGSIPLGSANADDVAVNVATNRLYLLYGTGPDLLEIDEPVAVPVPIDVAITVDPPSPDGSVDVSFSATTSFAPVALPIQRVYYQVDAIDGEWTAASPAGPLGSAAITGLAPGSHVIHAFATDGQEATIASDLGQPVVVGAIASLAIEVPAVPACSNGIDDDGDSLVDFPADPGCRNAQSALEGPQCDNGIDDDGDLAIDHPADAKCRTRWDNDEATNPSCGLGAELVGLLAASSWRRMRMRAARH